MCKGAKEAEGWKEAKEKMGWEIGPVDSSCNWKNRFVAMSSVVLDSRVSSNEFSTETLAWPRSRRSYFI